MIRLNFSMALEAAKNGACIAREGWNGKNMCVWINKGSHSGDVSWDRNIRGIDQRLFERGDEGTVTRLPNFNMKTADGCTLTGWIPTQTDLLSGDWIVVWHNSGEKEGDQGMQVEDAPKKKWPVDKYAPEEVCKSRGEKVVDLRKGYDLGGRL